MPAPQHRRHYWCACDAEGRAGRGNDAGVGMRQGGWASCVRSAWRRPLSGRARARRHGVDVEAGRMYIRTPAHTQGFHAIERKKTGVKSCTRRVPTVHPGPARGRSNKWRHASGSVLAERRARAPPPHHGQSENKSTWKPREDAISPSSGGPNKNKTQDGQTQQKRAGRAAGFVAP